MLNEYTIGDSRELLKEVESNSVDLIYIDPPYCTGRDFYHFDDRFSSSADYRELLLRPLFEECHRILTDVGNIVIHVEAKISHHVRIVLDDVFGEKRFKNEIVWFLVETTNQSINFNAIMILLLSIRKAKNQFTMQSTKNTMLIL